MARKLSPEDLTLLKKIAPELVDSNCGHAGWEFKSILPPVSQHISASPNDFRKRLLRLSGEELNYIVNLIFEGMESIHCVKKESIDELVEVVGEKVSKVKAAELLELYKLAGD